MRKKQSLRGFGEAGGAGRDGAVMSRRALAANAAPGAPMAMSKAKGGAMMDRAEKAEAKVAVAEASPDAYKELASVQAVRGKCWAAPVLASGRIYARSKGGALACVAIGK